MDKMVQIITESGFECTIDKAKMDDMRIMDALVDLQVGDQTAKLVALKTLLDKILGEDQKEKMYIHLEGKEGRASTGAVQEELMDIFKKIGEAGKK